MRTLLYGAKAGSLEKEVARHPELTLVETDPEIVVSYGGDGTLLSAEHAYPGVPKVPIRNSRRGLRTLHHPPAEVLEALAQGRLTPSEFIKLECVLREPNGAKAARLVAMNEFNIHMGRINSAVRFKVWLDDEPYEDGLELIGDGLLVSTPFGSTAYYNHITRGLFYGGIGVAFKYIAQHTTHMVLPEDCVVRVLITRGPAVLAYDSAPDYHDLEANSELVIRKADQPAVILTWGPTSKHPSQAF